MVLRITLGKRVYGKPYRGFESLSLRHFKFLYFEKIVNTIIIKLNMNLTKIIYKNYNKDLEVIWNEFEKKSYNYCFQSIYWLKNWYFNLNEKNRPDIYNVLIYSDQKLLMILPLCIEKKNGIRVLSWQGGDRADYMASLLSEEFFIEKIIFLKIWTEVLNEIKNYDLIYLKRQPYKIGNILNPFVTFLKNHNSDYTSSIILEKNYNLFLDKNIKPKFVSDTNRRIKNLETKGKLKFKIFDNLLQNEIKHEIRLLLANKIERILDLKLKNPFNEEAKKFYENFDDKEFNGIVHFSNLSINDTIISSHWGIVYKKCFYHLLPTIIDKSYYKYSPGRIHIQELIKWSIENSIDKFDFTIGEEEYKKDWVNKEDFLSSHVKLNNYLHIFYYFFTFLKIFVKKSLLKTIINKNKLH